MFRHMPFLCSLLLLVPAVVHAAEPELRTANVHGLQVGGVTKLIVEGDNFGTAPRLVLPFSAQQQLQPGGNDKKAEFHVTLDGKVIPGYYQLRLATDTGVSLPVLVAVDAMPQKLLGPDIENLPVALHGTVAGSAVTEAKFAGKAGQKVLVEVEAQRLGSKLRPIVHLYGSKRTELGWAWGRPALGGDARLEATLPADGTYVVAVHDAEYAPPDPGYFRLRIGQWGFVDQVFPPTVAKGQARAVEFVGSSTGTETALPATAKVGVLPLAWPQGPFWSGPRPFVHVSELPVVMEQPATGKPQDLPSGAVTVCGRLLQPFEEDQYRVPVVPRSKVRLEVFAERLHAPIDCALVIRNDQGAELARVEDSPGSADPVLEYTVPDKTTALIVGVVDGQGRGGPRAMYQLAIEPKVATAAKANSFQLYTLAQRITLPPGGNAVVPVLIERHGYDGPVDVNASLPNGVKLENATIPVEAEGALIALRRDEQPADVVVTTWNGKTSDGEERTAFVKGHALESLQPWLAAEVAIAPVKGSVSQFQIDWSDFPANAGLVPGGKLPLRVKTSRPDLDKTSVKLTLLTSQPTVLVNNQPDPAKTLRFEKAADLPAKMSDTQVTLLVPPTLQGSTYDVALQAEFLSADKKMAAVAYTPVKRLPVRLPVVVKLDGPARVDVPLNAKKGPATLKLQGTIERREGVKGDVTVAVAGLPAGVVAAPIIVKGEATAFTLTVTVPPTHPVGEITGVQLLGTIAADPKQANVTVRSRDVHLTINVIPQ